MSGKVTGRRRSSVKEKGSIKNFFGKKDDSEDVTEAGDKEVTSVRSSPDKTSDYESEASRSTTPTVSSVGSSPQQEVSTAVKREVMTEEEEDDDGQGADLFNSTADAEDLDDKAGVKAAIMSGLLSADVKDEEERMAAETLRMERQEEVKRKQELLKEAEELSVQQRFDRLQKLLGKSQFYTDFLLKKMKGHEAAMELKKQTNEARAKKRADKDQAVANAEKRRTGRNEEKEMAKSTPAAKRGRKSKAGEEPESKRMKTEDIVEDQEDVKKNRNEKDRQFEGKNIPSNQPLLLTGGIMRDYQLEGYEWMSTLWENGINGILADEMGLGKTIQTVALFCHMYEMGVAGPFLVVAPLSTVPNWCNEFERFAPKVPCVLYHGNMQERLLLREKLSEVTTCDEVDGKPMMNVVVTSYEIAMNDRAAFSSVMWRYIVVDEGHRLKNMNCRLIRELKQYHSANRLLLTGTPLQNNLSELWSLLNFLLPEIFDDLRVFESWFNAKELHENTEEMARIAAQEQQNSILSTLHQILTPFLLRRVKTDVDLEIPPKKEVLVYCPLTPRQEEMYRASVEKTLEEMLGKDEEKKVEVLPEKRKRTAVDYSLFLDEREFGNSDDKFEAHMTKLLEYRESLASSSNTASAYLGDIEKQRGNEKNFSMKSRMMDMRKSVNHPYLIEYPVTEDGAFYDSGPDMIDICGKLQVLDQMLEQLMAGDHKMLIFSQMTKMLDVLGDYCNMKKWKFCRLDGSMNFVDRQADIDKFNKDPEHRIFLLSTRAGGLGINLTAADTCIIYDSDWNPQQDLQAQDRCHRIGQTKPVMIYRLVTANTIDQRIVERAAAKRRLEKMIIHRSKFKAGAESVTSSLQSISAQELLTLLDSKDYCGAVSAGAGQVFTQEQLDQLLDRSDLAWGANPHNPVNIENEKKNTAVSGIKGVFQVIDQTEKNPDLGSVKDK
eukprot:GFUD01008533.1.p1 GENE.GFUD01008533.1~~GFUD01008533.1.p1  ORF type:complete len:945 (-),score=300.16 GFUD01008533.1:289-3123(-)